MSDVLGYRGYIASRPVRGDRIPQHVQNLVVRDYVQRTGLTFKLSAVEYAMPGCYMMLETVLDELPTLDGIVCYSLFMLPQRAEARDAVYRRVLGAGRSLHGALEGTAIRDWDDARRLEDIFLVDRFAGSATLAI
jgi:sporadic carbohydrate cluster protein (TIGR04323 family)